MITVPWPLKLQRRWRWTRVGVDELPGMFWRKLTTGEWFRVVQ